MATFLQRPKLPAKNFIAKDDGPREKLWVVGRFFFAVLFFFMPSFAFAAKDVERLPPAVMMDRAAADEAAGKRSRALRTYRLVARNYPDCDEAPESLKRRGMIMMRQHRYRRAFDCFQSILDRYPNYSGYMQVVEFESRIAGELMDGKRNYLFWGKVPWFRDRSGAIDFLQKIVERVPYGDFVPSALRDIAKMSLKKKDYAAAIAALEKLVDEYGNSPLAPDALLQLAKIYRNRVPGSKYDQKMAREAINCYNEFLITFPDSPLAPQAEEGLAEAMNFLANGKLSVGNFYYDSRQNPIAAKPYYEEVLREAPTDSQAALEAERRLADIADGKPGSGSPIDFLLGRYHRRDLVGDR